MVKRRRSYETGHRPKFLAVVDGSVESAKAIRFAGWVLEPARRRLLNPDGAEVPLTGGEYDLLQVLVERPNRVLTRDMLMDLLRGRQAGPFGDSGQRQRRPGSRQRIRRVNADCRLSGAGGTSLFQGA